MPLFGSFFFVSRNKIAHFTFSTSNALLQKAYFQLVRNLNRNCFVHGYVYSFVVVIVVNDFRHLNSPDGSAAPANAELPC